MAFTRNLLLTGIGTLGSRLLGLVRDASIAWLLGAGPIGDAFILAVRLPYLFRELLADGSLSLSLTTACSERGPDACSFALTCIRRIFTVLLLLLLASMLAVPPFISLLFSELPQKFQSNAAVLIQLCLPYTFFAVLTATCMAGLHAVDRFLLPSISPLLFNCAVLMGACIAYSFAIPPYASALLLAACVSFGGMLQFLPQYLRLCSLANRKRHPCCPVSDSSGRILSAVPASLTAAATPQLAFILACIPAAMLHPGHIASLFYAERLMRFPLGLTASALGMAAVPLLVSTAFSSAHTQKQRTSAVIVLGLCLSLPASSGLAAIAAPLICLLFGYGAFDEHACTLTTRCLCFLIPSIPAITMLRPLIIICHVAGMQRILNICTLLALGISLGAGLLFTAGLNMPEGPALSITLALWVQTAILWYFAAPKNVFSFSKYLLLHIVIASSLVYAAAFAITESIENPLCAVAIAVPTGIFVFAACMWPFRSRLSKFIEVLHK